MPLVERCTQSPKPLDVSQPIVPRIRRNVLAKAFARFPSSVVGSLYVKADVQQHFALSTVAKVSFQPKVPDAALRMNSGYTHPLLLRMMVSV